MPTISITKPLVAVVEGRDEQEFFPALIASRGLPDYQIICYEGKDKLRAYLKALSLTPGFQFVKGIAIFRDADDNPEGAADSVRNALKAAGLPAARAPMTVANDQPHTIYCIVPGGGAGGELEDACNASIADDGRFGLYTDFVGKFQDHTNGSLIKLAKVQVQIHLACQVAGPFTHLGIGARAGAWPLAHQAFNPLAEALVAVAEAASH